MAESSCPTTTMTDDGTTRPENFDDLIVEDHVKAALKADKGSDVQLTSWSAHDLTEAGDNFTALLASVKVVFSQNGESNEVDYVIKLDPLRGELWRDFIRMAFEKEVRFYEELVPALTSQLVAVGMHALRIPQCFFTSLDENQVIIQEDLRAQGYKLYDRTKTMDIPHTTLVLRELARLHAASLLLQDTDGKDLQVKYDFLSKHWSNFKTGAEEGYCTVMINSLENARVVLKKATGYERAIDWVVDLKTRVLRVFKEQTAITPPFAVVCHFDPVSNNFLFRYNALGEPVDIRLLDFQMCYRASLATDLTEFFLTCLSGPERRANLDCFLRTYYTSFSMIFKAKNMDVPFTYMRLWEEYRAKLTYGAMSSIVKIPYIIAEGKEIPDMDEYVDQEIFNNARQKSMLIMLDKYKSFSLRFLSIFDDLDQFEILR